MYLSLGFQPQFFFQTADTKTAIVRQYVNRMIPIYIYLQPKLPLRNNPLPNKLFHIMNNPHSATKNKTRAICISYICYRLTIFAVAYITFLFFVTYYKSILFYNEKLMIGSTKKKIKIDHLLVFINSNIYKTYRKNKRKIVLARVHLCFFFTAMKSC